MLPGSIETCEFEITYDPAIAGSHSDVVALSYFDGQSIQTISDVVFVFGSATDPGTVEFSSDSYDGSEEGETATITLTRSGGSDGPVTATVTASPDSAGAADFTGTTFTASWTDGETGDQSISIPIVDDALFEGPEDFTIEISNGGAATVGEVTSATVTIADNDGAPDPGTVEFSSSSYVGSEAEETAIVTLTRFGGGATDDGGVDGALTVTITASATSGGASVADFEGTIFTASWADGETGDQTINIPIVDDALFEGPEDFAIEISDGGAATVGELNSATVTIADNDSAQDPGTVEFSSSSYDGSEAEETAIVTLTRFGGGDESGGGVAMVR